jgi:hypothetical protein
LKVSMKVKKLVASKRTLADVQGELPDQMSGEVAFAGEYGLCAEPVHLAPETLAGQLFGADREQAAQDGAFKPGGDLPLAARLDSPVEGGDQHLGANAGPAWAASSRDVAVDVLDQTQPLGQAEPGGHGPELGDDGGSRGGGRALAERGDAVAGLAQVFLPDDLGLAFDAPAFPRVIGGLAPDRFLDDADHGVGHTGRQGERQYPPENQDLRRGKGLEKLGHTFPEGVAEKVSSQGIRWLGLTVWQVDKCWNNSVNSG